MRLGDLAMCLRFVERNRCGVRKKGTASRGPACAPEGNLCRGLAVDLVEWGTAAFHAAGRPGGVPEHWRPLPLLSDQARPPAARTVPGSYAQVLSGVPCPVWLSRRS